jgi:hypothetical protein
MKTFCTIITANYYPRALALYKSLAVYDNQVELWALIADNKPVPEISRDYPNLKLLAVSDLGHYPLVDKLYHKYAHINLDFFRWSLKPLLISYLLEEKRIDKLLYTDCDMFFVNDYTFLFDELDHSAILLTPHWKNNDPLLDSTSFYALFRSGIFTAGFVGANRQALPAMQWWAEACHFLMGEHPGLSIHDDQRYLDIFPVYFEGTKIIRHRGCTIGAWHYEQCKRVLVNGQVLINGEWPIIFIHFEEMLVSQIMKGHDPLLQPYLEQYRKIFEESGYKLAEFIKGIDTYASPGLLLRVKWSWKIRTRLKRFFYTLAKSM